jgi:hypothetical protein
MAPSGQQRLAAAIVGVQQASAAHQNAAQESAKATESLGKAAAAHLAALQELDAATKEQLAELTPPAVKT